MKYLNQIADEVGLSPQYLSKIFKENYGVNFIDYITKKNPAMLKLFNSTKSIKEISCLVGYEDLTISAGFSRKIQDAHQGSSRLQKAMGEH